jgi:hypothetical protein
MTTNTTIMVRILMGSHRMPGYLVIGRVRGKGGYDRLALPHFAGAG